MPFASEGFVSKVSRVACDTPDGGKVVAIQANFKKQVCGQQHITFGALLRGPRPLPPNQEWSKSAEFLLNNAVRIIVAREGMYKYHPLIEVLREKK